MGSVPATNFWSMPFRNDFQSRAFESRKMFETSMIMPMIIATVITDQSGADCGFLCLVKTHVWITGVMYWIKWLKNVVNVLNK